MPILTMASGHHVPAAAELRELKKPNRLLELEK
jgi:hypothetical protein